MTAPGAISTTEDVATPLTGIAFADVDAGSGSVSATFTVGAGTLAATSGSGVTVGGTATNLTLNGTITAINNFIAGNQLTYTTDLNATTTQTLGVSLNDNGNTGAGGALTSGVTQVNLNVTPVNDAPSFTKGTDQTIMANSGAQTISNWATGFNPGSADESGQTLQAYVVTVDTNPGIFAVAPAIDALGQLTYTPANTIATATTARISVRVRDDGGTANGGIDTSEPQTFVITVTTQPQPAISIGNVYQPEEYYGTLGTFTLTLDTPAPAGGLTVNFTPSGTATRSTDYSFTNGNNITSVSANSFVIAAGATTATLKVVRVNDGIVDPGKTVILTLASGNGYFLGGFSGSTSVYVGSRPSSVAIGDLNGDGKADIATANPDSNNVSVLLEDGMGSFSSATTVPVGLRPTSVVIGDLNGDGKADIATANLSSNTVSVLLNTPPTATLTIQRPSR